MGVLVLYLCLASLVIQQPAPITERFPLLHGNATTQPAVTTAPDPLVSTTWSAATNCSRLQRYETTVPQSWLAEPPDSFKGDYFQY